VPDIFKGIRRIKPQRCGRDRASEIDQCNKESTNWKETRFSWTRRTIKATSFRQNSAKKSISTRNPNALPWKVNGYEPGNERCNDDI